MNNKIYSMIAGLLFVGCGLMAMDEYEYEEEEEDLAPADEENWDNKRSLFWSRLPSEKKEKPPRPFKKFVKRVVLGDRDTVSGKRGGMNGPRAMVVLAGSAVATGILVYKRETVGEYVCSAGNKILEATAWVGGRILSLFGSSSKPTTAEHNQQQDKSQD